MVARSRTGILKALVSPRSTTDHCFDVEQANILVSNDTPPRALLTDFGFTTVVPDPVQPMAQSAQFEGGAMTFMSPELLVPEEFGMNGATPTTQADIYAFGLVIYQVCHASGIVVNDRSNVHPLQVLTCETPFHGIRQSALAYHVLRGKRPDKPDNAASIGLSDSLWNFVQRCWDGKMELRPQVGEVVANLKEAAGNWDGLMPPHEQVTTRDENDASGSKGTLGSKRQSEFEILRFP